MALKAERWLKSVEISLKWIEMSNSTEAALAQALMVLAQRGLGTEGYAKTTAAQFTFKKRWRLIYIYITI